MDLFGNTIIGYLLGFGFQMILWIQDLIDIILTDNFLTTGRPFLEWFFYVGASAFVLYLGVLIVGTLIPD